VGGVSLATESISNVGLRLTDQLCGGIYGEEDRKFMFCNALVGVKSKARIKISNIKKVSVSVSCFDWNLRCLYNKNSTIML